MSAKFFESIGSKLADKWVATLLTPAFIFWAGGAAVGVQIIGWADISSWFIKQPEPLQVALLIAALSLITVSAFVVQRFDLVVLRFLEGYWHPWLNPFSQWFVSREIKRTQRIGDRWQMLMQQRERTSLNRREHDEFIQLDWQYLHLPLPEQLMPTRLGNNLRAAEQRPLEKYGLDAVICWSRLWLLLPDSTKKELQSARADLNTAARVWLWSLLFILWAFIGAWWAEEGWWTSPLNFIAVCWPAIVGILSAVFAYYNWAISAAITYGELIEATFDLYRHLLYDFLRWHLPADPNEERRVGQQLTQYLLRGF